MTDTTPENVLSTLPASTQSAIEKLHSAKSGWLKARHEQNEASARIENIHKLRAETDKSANSLNEEWRTLFRENNGAITPEMKKLRTEIALERETLEEFDALLTVYSSESEFLPWETADRAEEYIQAHNHLSGLRAMQIWQDFMEQHGQKLIQTLALLKITLGRASSNISGVVHTVNDPESVLKNFISKNITDRALITDALPEEDPVFRLAGMDPDFAAQVDYRKASSPAARHKMLVRRQIAQKGEKQ